MFINYAHRGASEYYPENTRSSFEAGLAMGANGIETDVQRTADGVLVLFHDDTLTRVTGAQGKISDYTYAQLQQLEVSSKDGSRKDRILSLEDFLRQFGKENITFAIELKVPGVEKDTIDMLNAFSMKEKVVLTSFLFACLQAAKAYDPSYRVGYLYEGDVSDPLGQLLSIGGEEMCPEAEALTEEDTRRWHGMGLSVRAWGIYDTQLMEHVLACGADGMTVNFPDLLTARLQKCRP